MCEHIHLPLQAGSSRVLKRDAPHLHARALPRPRRADPRARARTARSRPTSSSASRGRPRRTSRETLEVAEEVGFDGAFTFIYSPRRGTEAAAFADDFLPHEVCVERMERLVEVIQRRARERAQRFVGRTLDVLVEGTSRTDAEPRARPHAPQQGRQLRRPRRAGRDRPGHDHARDAARRSTGEESAARPRPRAERRASRRPSVVMRTYVRALGIRRSVEQDAAGRASRATRRRSSAASTPRRHSTPASTRSTPSPRSTGSRAERGSRSLDRQPVPRLHAMPAVTASPGRRTSTWTSTRGRTSSARSSSRSTCPEVLRAELARPSWKGETVALGTNTDPYQWVEGRYKLMRGDLGGAARRAQPVLDPDEVAAAAARPGPAAGDRGGRPRSSACLSVPTLDEKAWRATEPHTPNPRARLEAVAQAQRGRDPDRAS